MFFFLKGDSGGPLMVKNGNAYYLAGITSLTDGGCSGKYGWKN